MFIRILAPDVGLFWMLRLPGSLVGARWELGQPSASWNQATVATEQLIVQGRFLFLIFVF